MMKYAPGASNARVAIEEYAFYYGKLFTKRSKK